MPLPVAQPPAPTGTTVPANLLTAVPTGVPTVGPDGVLAQVTGPGTGVVTVGNATASLDNGDGGDRVVRIQPTQAPADDSSGVLFSAHVEVYVRPAGSDAYQKETGAHVVLSVPFTEQQYRDLLGQFRQPTFQLVLSDGTVETIPTYWSPTPAPGVVWADVVPRSLYRLVVEPWHVVSRSVPADERYFPETGFRINRDLFWDYFQRRGGLRTFGYPVSRDFVLEGFEVQIFQRGVMQLMPSGYVATMNLLEEGLMPYARINHSIFPSPDPALILAAPTPRDPEFGPKALAFLHAHVPNEWEGVKVNFLAAYLGTVRYEDAFPNGGESPDLVPMLNLELWGLPTSQPAYDPNNKGFVYQRFQRGILHHDIATGTTQGLLLADHLKSVFTGVNLPADLEEQARGCRLYRQYLPGTFGSMARPALLRVSNLDLAFEPEVVRGQ